MGECSATCGGGRRTIKREIVQEPENGGERCPILEETMVCKTDECPGNPLPFGIQEPKCGCCVSFNWNN